MENKDILLGIANGLIIFLISFFVFVIDPIRSIQKKEEPKHDIFAAFQY